MVPRFYNAPARRKGIGMSEIIDRKKHFEQLMLNARFDELHNRMQDKRQELEPRTWVGTQALKDMLDVTRTMARDSEDARKLIGDTPPEPDMGLSMVDWDALKKFAYEAAKRRNEAFTSASEQLTRALDLWNDALCIISNHFDDEEKRVLAEGNEPAKEVPALKSV